MLSGSSLFFKDGSVYLRGEATTTTDDAQSLFSITLTPNGTNSYSVFQHHQDFSSDEVNLPPGLIVSADASRLYFVSDAVGVSTPSTFSSLQLSPQPAAGTGSLCLITYGLPGNVDYPWSVSTQLTVGYVPVHAAFTQSQIPANPLSPTVLIVNASGTRTYTNRFGVSFTTSVILAPPNIIASNVLYLNSTSPFDSNGLLLIPAVPLQLPGDGPIEIPYPWGEGLIRVYNASGVWQEGVPFNGAFASRVDGQGQAWLSSIPGAVNVTIGPSNLNALAPLLLHLPGARDVQQWSPPTHSAQHQQRRYALPVLVLPSATG